MLPIESDNPQADVAVTPAQEQIPATNQPSYITSEQFAQAMAELKQSMSELYRGVQSRTDQIQAKVQKRIEGLENAAKASGLQLTESQRKTLQDSALIQTLSEEASPVQPAGKPGQTFPKGESADDLVARVNRLADEMMVISGVQIEEGDPENSLLVEAEAGTPQQYINQVQKAIDAKLARIKSSPAQPQTNPATIKSPGLVKGVPQSNPIQNVNDPGELWSLAKKNLG